MEWNVSTLLSARLTARLDEGDGQMDRWTDGWMGGQGASVRAVRSERRDHEKESDRCESGDAMPGEGNRDGRAMARRGESGKKTQTESGEERHREERSQNGMR